MKLRYHLLCIVLVVIAMQTGPGGKALAESSHTSSFKPVTLQLRWLHQFQFAGYYAALQQGYYRDAGLDVTLKQGGGNLNTVEEVLIGRSDFGVTNSEILLHRLQGKPLVVMAAVFQHSPLVMVAKQSRGIHYPQDLAGRRVRMSTESRDVELHAMLLNEGLSLDRLTIVPCTPGYQDYQNDSIDALSAYITNEPFVWQKQGIRFNVIRPSTYGIDFYGDCLFTTQTAADRTPGQVLAFREASLKGWAYAMEHPEEIIREIVSTYGSEKSVEHLRYEADSMRDLVLPDLVEIGHMNSGRWRHIADIFERFGLAPKAGSLDGFMFGSDPRPDYSWVPWALGAAGIVVVISSIIALMFFLFNRRLRQEISLRSNTESQLKESESRFKAIFDHMATGVAVCDVTGSGTDFVVRNINAAGARISPMGVEDPMGRSLLEVYPGIRELGFYDVLQQVWESGVPRYFPLTLHMENRLSLWLETYVCKLPSGEIVVVCDDISERKKAEADLVESQRTLDNLIKNLPGIAFRCRNDQDWTMEFISEGCLPLTGYEPWELVGNTQLSYNDLIHPDDRAGVASGVEQGLAEDGTYEIEYRITTRNGEIRDLWERGVGVESEPGVFQALEGFVTDITERKQSQAAIRESHRTFLTVLDSIDATIYVADMDTCEILFMNKCMIDSFGADYTGRICHEVFRNEAEPCSCCTNTQLVDAHGNARDVCIWEAENPVTGKWYVNYDRAVKWLDGRLVRLQIAMDVTHMKSMEKELRQAYKMEAIGVLAGGIAHDFNNILASIIGFTDLALDDVEVGSQLEEHLREIAIAGRRAKDLVRQILTFARQSDEEQRPLRIDIVASEVLKLLSSLIPASIAIKRDFRSRSFVMADPVNIHQLFMNLCTNAAHSMGKDSGVLTISLSDVDLDSADAGAWDGIGTGRYLKLMISDTGTGIPAEIMDSIFDPYFTTKRVGEGTGMGLAVTLGIVKRYRGAIRVDSAPGAGTTVTVLLPVTAAGEEAAAEDPVTLPIGPERILCVDDEPALTRMLARILGRLGYTVVQSNDSGEALSLFRSDPGGFDLVITDMTMPGMAGDRLAAEMVLVRPDIPIIISTGYTDHQFDVNDSGGGIRAVAFKPVVKNDLARTVRRLLDE